MNQPRAIQLAESGACDVNFWDFALPVALGSLAGLCASIGTRRLMQEERPRTQEAGAAVAHAVAFWAFGGMTFVLRSRHRRTRRMLG